ATAIVEAPFAIAPQPQAAAPPAFAAIPAAVQPATSQVQAAAMPQPQAQGTAAAAPASDPRQTAIWTLRSAREQIRAGNYDEASKLVAQAQAMNVQWNLFDDTPAKVAEAIEKARPKAVVAAVPNQTRDHRTAKTRLKEARALLANNQFEQAEAI